MLACTKSHILLGISGVLHLSTSKSFARVATKDFSPPQCYLQSDSIKRSPPPPLINKLCTVLTSPSYQQRHYTSPLPPALPVSAPPDSPRYPDNNSNHTLAEPIPQKPKRIPTQVLDLIILVPRLLQQVEIHESRAREDRQGSVHSPLLEPGTAARGPGRASQVQVGVLDEGFRDGAPRRQRFDVLGLHSADEGEEVLRQLFDDGEEGAVAEGAVGAGYGPVVGDWSFGGG